MVLEDGELTVTAYAAGHAPIEPAVGYRIDYRGRSVVISGDSRSDRRHSENSQQGRLAAARRTVPVPLTEAADNSRQPKQA